MHAKLSCLISGTIDSFFFQAEDGIRDKLVTGVQTCALPIWANSSRILFPQTLLKHLQRATFFRSYSSVCFLPRSEERRVGKECRCRWSLYQEKKEQVQETAL